MENEIISGRQTLVVIAGFRTGVSVEDAFWNRLKEIAADRNMTLSDLVTTINSEREHNNLSSAIRLFVLDHYRRQAVSSAEEAPERFLTNKGPKPRPLRSSSWTPTAQARCGAGTRLISCTHGPTQGRNHIRHE
jgi:predicted DNA-binding ribbon-helix-helix protein